MAPRSIADLPERIQRLDVTCAGTAVAELVKASVYSLRYGKDVAPAQALSLLLPIDQVEYTDGDLFPSMDMNLPEGYLFQRILERFGKRTVTKMHLLALMGDNAVGRVGYVCDDLPDNAVRAVDRQTLMRGSASVVFEGLVAQYLGTSVGVAGVQPKVMLPSRAAVPVPDLIVKAAGEDFPGLAGNEYLCLSAAKRAGLAVPGFELNDDASLLLIDRFDLTTDEHDGRVTTTRLGFEDIAAIMGLRVLERLSTRKYKGSYERVAEAIRAIGGRHMAENLQRFFEQLTLSVMVRNGDAHLKNFGLIYDDPDHPRMSPLFDVVTTSIYKVERPGGIQDEDRTLALRFWHRGTRAYPTTEDLVKFGRTVCEVDRPAEVLDRIAQGMSEALRDTDHDERISPALLASMRAQWIQGMQLGGTHLSQPVSGRKVSAQASGAKTMAGYYMLKRSGTQFVFNLKAANHQTILTSERYSTKQAAEGGISAVKANSAIDLRYQRKMSSANQPYFVLTASNGQTIGVSEMYSSTSAMENGITSCKTNGPTAPTKDET